MAFIKEPYFFTEEKGYRDGGEITAPYRSGNFSRGLNWYLNLFDNYKGAKAFGEVSPDYVIAQDSPQLIKKIVPTAQLICILRDPVDRLYSNYWQVIRGGKKMPPIKEMIIDGHPFIKRQIFVSSYQIHLQKYFSVFPRDQLSIFLFEDMKDLPEHFVQTLYNEVGVNPSFSPANLGLRYNGGNLPHLLWLQRFFSFSTNHLQDRISKHPDLYKDAINAGRPFVKLNSSQKKYPPLPVEVRYLLEGYFHETISYIEDLLGRPLISWIGSASKGKLLN